MKHKLFFILWLALVTVCCSQHQNIITDLIQPVSLKQESTTKLLLSDLFYAENYNVKFFPDNNFDIKLNDSDNTIEITPLNYFSGIDLISFEYSNRTYELPVKLDLKKKYSFAYKPEGTPERINLFGQFNGWNRENLPMKDENGDGVYSITIPLDPGRYEYKFYVDGAELIDPENPIKVPNGMGDFNSVLVISKSVDDIHYLHLLNYRKDDNAFSYNFFYESADENVITKNDIVALLDNFKIKNENIGLVQNKISLSFNQDELKGERIIRIAASKNGKATNFQTVRLKNGLPTGKDPFDNWDDAIIYSIMIDRFNDGDTTNDKPIVHPELSKKANYQGGDLKGIIDKLDEGYFDSLGVNTLWISPIVDNTDKAYKEFPPPHRYFTGYHGYWPISATNVEEHFGDMTLVKKFVSTSHNHGIKVLLDYIAHHVHEEHPFWKEHREWFGQLELPDGRKNLRLFDEQRLTTWFEPYMPSFDYERSKEALGVMTDNAVWWLKETSADGFRHDAVKHVPNKFWRTLTKKIKQEIEIPDKKVIYQIGETFGDFNLISSYVNNGQLSSQFNFNLYDVAIPVFLNADNSFELLDLQMQKSFFVYGVNHLMGNLMDSHDKIRYMAYADSDIEINSNDAKEIGWNNPPTVDHPSSYKKLQLYMAYVLTIPGVPVIYYGDEIGMTGAADPDNRRMMRFGDDLNIYEKENFKEISKLTHLRKNHSALRQGDFFTLVSDDNCYAYIRSDMNERILIILNKSEENQKVNLSLPAIYNLKEAFDLSNKKAYEITDNKLMLDIPAIGWQIFQLK